MPRDALLQVRLDPEEKKEAEKLFASMGLTLSEAVRLFVAQSTAQQTLPFTPTVVRKHGTGAAFGMLNIFASPAKREKEREAWVSSLSMRASSQE